MPTIKRVDYLYHADLKENQERRLSDFQNFHLWHYIWQVLPVGEITRLLPDLIHSDISSIEGIADVDYKGSTSVKGVKLNQYIADQPSLFDGRLYRVYYLRRSKAFLTYQEITMKRKES